MHGFDTRKAQLERDVPELARALGPEGIWRLSYPKGHVLATDLNRDVLRVAAESKGLDTVALVAADGAAPRGDVSQRLLMAPEWKAHWLMGYSVCGTRGGYGC